MTILPRRSIRSKLFWGTISVASELFALCWPHPPQYLPVVERIRIPIAGLPDGLQGMTIALLSDFHAGPQVHAATLRLVAQQTMALRPDLIALAGDFVHRDTAYAEACAHALSILRAPLGVHTVLGNHDYSQDARTVIAELTRVGLKPLRNEARRLTRHGEPFYLVGVDDVRRRQNDHVRALAGVPSDAFKLLLVHEPDFADFVQGRQIALQLSGHSHGGQIRLPRIGALLLPTLGRKYPQGLHHLPDGGWLYTTRGIGVATIPLRVNCPPEISLLTLGR